MLTGSEDGRLVGWDLNSQKVILNRNLSTIEAEEERNDMLKGSTVENNESRKHVCSVDFSGEKSDLVAVSGSVRKGV